MESQETAQPKTQPEKSHERSANYPGLPLEKAIDFATKIYMNFSSNTSVTRNEVATVFKMHPNSIARDFAACAQYGLLSKSAEGYKITELFDDIHRPENESQKKLKLLLAFGSAKLNQVLIEKFDGHVIPYEFPNTLVKHHGITEKASEEAANIFIESGKYVGAINENRVLLFKDTVGAIQKQKVHTAEVIVETPKESSASQENLGVVKSEFDNQLPALEGKLKKVPIHLTKDKEAYFAYPANMSEKDVKLVEHQLAGILMRIQFENEEKKESNT